MNQPGWQPLLDAIDAATDPRVKHALQLVAEHVVAEVEGDIPRLLATLVPEPTYRFWGAGMNGRTTLTGETQVRSFYDHLIGSGKNRLDYVLDRVVADAATVITEGVIHHVLDGADLVGRVSTPVEAGHWYHVTYQSLILWPIDPASGLLTGEEVYLGSDHTVVREISAEELPHLGSTTRGVG
ncbi:hypothetical protein [Sporichthya sp.]|uniref:hypothetical protein n=1 Tax=Sporichthya sp. TaxID=65475 RepID=UPI0017F59E71|nr:hypothetical protein [Sporichthya sp.]MBA3743329.1 nuclear transport factor 2 family protein [Sporichthya sp.]